MTNPMIFIMLIKVRLFDDQNVEAPHHAERRSLALSPKALPPLKARHV
jgi:hypothetical protein